MPQVEAACCGVPVAAVDYSAMEDVVRHTKGYPIKVEKMFRELNTNAERAYPDNSHLAEILQKHFSESEEYRINKSQDARQGAMSRYDWDATAEIWENYIDSYQPIANQGKWDSAIQQCDLPDAAPQGMSYEQFVKWCFSDLIQSPERMNSYDAQKYLASLDFGCFLDGSYGPQLEPFNVDKMFSIFRSRAEEKNVLERLRVGALDLTPMTFLKKGNYND